MKMTKTIIAAGAALLSLVGLAKTDSHFTNDKGADIAYNSKGDVVRGEWTSQFEKAMKQAKSEGVPVVVFWANNGCSHCAATEVQLCDSKFTTWMKKQQLYMVFTCGSHPSACGTEAAAAKLAAKDSSGQFPYIGVYWSQKKSSFKGEAGWNGNKPIGTFTGNGLSAATMISNINAMLTGYSPCVGGWFVYNSGVTDEKVDDAAKLTHHYEADIAKTTKVTLHLTRSTKNLAAGTDSLVVYKTNGKTVLKTYSVEWAKNAKTVDVDVSVEGAFTKAGQTIKAVLNGKTDAKYIANIFSVKRENAASNPDFDGCAAFGQWTMDLVAAKKYALVNAGYTLVSVQGSLWCHDCANTDRNFLEVTNAAGKNAFAAWARANKIALVTIDIPNFTGTKYTNFASPCLLSTKAYGSTLAYESNEWGIHDVSLGGAPAALAKEYTRSGLAYLSRNMISAAEAKTALAASHALVYLNTDEGIHSGSAVISGFHRYFDDKTEDGNANRTGVPIFVMLDGNGKVVARFTDFASVSPLTADKAKFNDYMKRFDEMLTIARATNALDDGEIENNRAGEGSPSLAFDSVASNRLCAADRMDTFLLHKDGSVRGSVQLKAADVASRDAEVMVQFWQEKDGTVVSNGAPVTVKLASAYGVALTNAFEEAGACYVKVMASFKGDDTRENNFIAYDIKSAIDSVMPLDTKVTITIKELTMAVAQGQLYRFGGVENLGELGFVAAEDGLYRWPQADGKVVLKADASGEISYQKWNPGTITFAIAEEEITKGTKPQTKTVNLVRQNGLSGTVSIAVKVDEDNTDFYYDINRGTKDEPRFQLEDAVDDTVVLTWAEGDDAVKTVSLVIETEAEASKWYGDGTITLSGGDGETTYALTVKEPGAATQSTVSIAGISPAVSYGTTVYARRSEGVTLTLSRSPDGYYGGGEVLVISDGSVKYSGEAVTNGNHVIWGERDYAEKTVKVTKLPKAGKEVAVTLGKVKKSFEVNSAVTYTIVSVDDEAPAFEVSKLSTIKTVRYAPVSAKVALVGGSGEGTLGYEIIKGSLPDGVTAKVKSGKLVISGTVKGKAGTYKVYFRATETIGTGKKATVVEGLTLYVPFKVIDPVTVDPTDPTYGHLSNTAVKTTRTLESIPVYADEDGTNRLYGTVTVTIPATGKVSAKYYASNRSKAVSFSATRWQAKSMTDEDGTLTADLTSATEGYAMAVAAQPDGVVVITIVDPRCEKPLVATSVGKVWSASYSAKKYRGRYTTTMLVDALRDAKSDAFSAPVGNGYVCLTMTSKTDYNAGTMKWAGKLPNGTAFSGSTVLSVGKTSVFGKSGFAYLPIIFRGAKDADGNCDRFTAVLAVKKGAADSDGAIVKAIYGDPELDESLPLARWQHIGGTSAAQTSYDADILAYGSYYDSERSLTDCCGGKTKQNFVFSLPEFVKYGTPVAIPNIRFTVKPTKLVLSGDGAVDFVLNNSGKPTASGVVSGTFKLPYVAKSTGKAATVKATWAGVVLPGWSFCNCGEGVEEKLDLPFISGCYWFKDAVPYETERGAKTAAELGGAALVSESVN